ncbi:MAG TPA: hypothetical protein VH678_25175 [Xanthobacteraceae bacterium]|jgi:hypothetical protein
MTATRPVALADPGLGWEGAAPGDGLWEPTIKTTFADITVPLCTFAASLGGLLLVMIGPFAATSTISVLTLATLVVPLVFLISRLRTRDELTIPVLLVATSLAAGPIGALGCAYLASRLRRCCPRPSRLRSWYAYIAGIAARDRIGQICEDLHSGRLPHDPTAEVPRFRPILHDASTDEQQRVLGVLGRRYHADFRPALRDALRNKNSFIRAQAAAVASRLDVEEKSRLWSSTPPADTTGEP